jgi:hypothetical protein
LKLVALDGLFAVCRLEPGAPVPEWAAAGAFSSITRSRDELSVVCAQQALPPEVRREPEWRCLRVAGTLPFSAVGVMASLTAPLAAARIGIFVISTFDTDYLLVKALDYEKTVSALRQAGHSVE